MSEASDLRKKQKLKCFEEWMQDDHVLVHLDSRKPGVQVPDYLKNNAGLTLKLSYLFQGKTEYNETGVTAYLRFSGDYFGCVLPWEAIWGLTASDGKNRVWTDDLPREVMIEAARAKFSEFTEKLFSRKKKPEEKEDQAAEATGKKTPPLKRIK